MITLLLFCILINVDINICVDINKSDPLKINITQMQKKIKYGELIEFKLDITNLDAEKSIIIDTQPYYLLTSGIKSIKSPNMLYIVRYKGSYSTVNHVYVTEKSSEYISNAYHWDWKYPIYYSLDEIPYTVILKPHGAISETVRFEPDLYKDYLGKGDWNVEFHVGWDISDKKHTNYVTNTYVKGNFGSHPVQNIKNLKIPIINSFAPGSSDWPKEIDREKYLKRKPFHRFAVSNKIVIKVE
jgi:hypothetical protein